MRESLHLGLLVVGILAARSTLADHYYVPSGSMEYTLMPGDRVLVDKCAYGLRMPFTTMKLTHGHLSINGDWLATTGADDIEVFGDKKARLNLLDGGGPGLIATIDHGMVLAIGDHRGNSADGRYFGAISEDEIYGRAVAIYYRRAGGLGWYDL